MYTVRNFRTKKDLKAAVTSENSHVGIQDTMFGTAPTDGIVYLEGPHYPAPHTWYAKATMKDGRIVKVK